MPNSPANIADIFPGGHLDRDRLLPLPVDLTSLPDGWMTPLELQVLYNLSRFGKGDFLEIGTYIGKSTIAIALGFRDAAGSRKRCLDVNDFGFTSVEEACEGLHVGPAAFNEDHVLRSFYYPGGIIGRLIDNLRMHGVLKHVTSVIRGNAATAPFRIGYEVIFCDATHSDREISVVGPVLARLLKPGAWLMCDDIHGREDLIAALKRYVRFDFFHCLADFGIENKAAIGRVAEPHP